MLIFGLCSICDDQLSNLSDESQPKCKKRPPKSSENEMFIFGLHLFSDDKPSHPSNCYHYRKVLSVMVLYYNNK